MSKKYIFDLDNTLVYTDFLNNKSYNYALNLLGYKKIDIDGRINRDTIISFFPELNLFEREELIKLKQEFFLKNLALIKPNEYTIQFLRLQKYENCILWTSADLNRVIAILEYYKIKDNFLEIIQSKKCNIEDDIRIICEIFDCKEDCLIFLEDNDIIVQKLKEHNLTVY